MSCSCRGSGWLCSCLPPSCTWRGSTATRSAACSSPSRRCPSPRSNDATRLSAPRSRTSGSRPATSDAADPREVMMSTQSELIMSKSKLTPRRIARVVTVPPLGPGFVGPGHLAAPVVSPDDFARTDPFIVLMDDHLDIGERQVGGAHPHAGFETVTLVLDGA